MPSGPMAFELRRLIQVIPRRWPWLLAFVLVATGGGWILLLLAHVVTWETSFDSWLHAYQNVRRIELRLSSPGNRPVETPLTMPALAPLINAKAKERGVYLQAARLSQPTQRPVMSGQERAILPVSFADPAFASILGLPTPSDRVMVESVLARGLAVVTEDSWRQLGGGMSDTADIAGTTVEVEGIGQFRIGAVLPPLPANTHLRLGIILPMARKPVMALAVSRQEWTALDLYTYIRAGDGESWRKVERFLRDLIDRYSPRYTTTNQKGRIALDLVLRPLPDIHLASTGLGQMRPPGNADMIQLYRGYGILVAVTLLLGALMAASLYELVGRLEWGIRRLTGASVFEIFKLKALEYGVILVGAGILVWPLFRLSVHLVARGIYGSTALGCSALLCDPVLATGVWLAGAAGLAVSIGAAMTLLIVRVPLAALLKRATGRAMKLFRSGLVAAQSALCALVLVGGAVAVLQLGQLLSLERGFRWEGRVLLDAAADADRARQLAASLAGVPEIQSLAFLGRILPLTEHARVPVSRIGGGERMLPVEADVIPVSPKFAAVMELDLVAGRWFSTNSADRLRTGKTKHDVRGRVVVDEKLARLLGFQNPEDAIGERIKSRDLGGDAGLVTQTLEIIGVVRPVRLGSLEDDPPATYFVYDPRRLDVIVARLAEAGDARTVSQLEKTVSAALGEVVRIRSLDLAYGAQLERWRVKRTMFLMLAVVVLVLVAAATFVAVSGRLREDRRSIALHRLFGAGVGFLLWRYAGRQFFLLWPAIMAGVLLGALQRDWLIGRFTSQIHVGVGVHLLIFGFLSLFILAVLAVTVIGRARESIAVSLREE